MKLPTVTTYYGVDFSGAKEAGRNSWIARLEPRRRTSAPLRVPLALTSLHRLESLAGTAARGPALAHLVELVRASDAAVWGFDFPFGLPVELFDDDATWAEQFAFLAEGGDEAYDCGLECIRRAKLVGDRIHIRRTTDYDSKASFDCYHYRSDEWTRKRPKFRGGGRLRTSHGSHGWHESARFPPGSLHRKLHRTDTSRPRTVASPRGALRRC